MIKMSSIKKIYKNDPSNLVLNDINLNISQGEFIAVMGKSGSGKTTLLNMISGVDRPTSGSIKINGVEITNLNDDQITIFRRENIGFVFQDFHLLPMLNVYENITLPIGLNEKNMDDYRDSIEKIIELFELKQKKFSSISELSGGQRQRVAIARALSSNPKIILADEPTGNLDTENGKRVLRIFKEINLELGQTILMVTHDLDAAKSAGRIIIIKDGELIA
jgi:hypothetical protein